MSYNIGPGRTIRKRAVQVREPQIVANHPNPPVGRSSPTAQDNPRYIRGTTQTRLGQTTQQRGGRDRPTRTAGLPGVAGLPRPQPSLAGGTDWIPSREVWRISSGKAAASRSGSGPSSGRAFLAATERRMGGCPPLSGQGRRASGGHARPPWKQQDLPLGPWMGSGLDSWLVQ